MPLKIALEVEGPGQEVFVVRGLPEVGPEVLVAVQRIDDQRYLTLHRLWDTAPSWHPCARIVDDRGEGQVRFAANPSLAAGIRAAAGAGLQMHLRRGAFSDLGPLVLSDPEHGRDSRPGPEAIPSASPQGFGSMDSPFEDAVATPAPSDDGGGSNGLESGQPAAAPHPPLTARSPASDLAWSATPPPEASLPLEPAMRSVSVEPPSQRGRAGTSRWLALLIVVLVVVVLLGLGIWALLWKSAPDGVPSQSVPTLKTTPTPVPQVPGRHGPAPVPALPGATEGTPLGESTKPSDSTSTSPSGKALYIDLKGKNLSPSDLFRRGEQADRTGDCEASIRLLIDAAKRAPALAERLARRYDPEGFEPTPCFPQPKPDSAIVWYQNAAEQDIPAAQRRYGELLIGEAASGPVYQDGVDWLRKAASAGDKAAARRLETLGER